MGTSRNEWILDTNQALTDDDEVPKYRTIAGQYVDKYKRPLVITTTGLEFVNEIRMRNGVEELQLFSIKDKILNAQDPNMVEFLKNNFGFDVFAFRFSSVQIVGIISAIRTKFIDWLKEIQPSIDNIRKSIEKNTPKVIVSKKKEKKWYQYPVVIAALVTTSGAIIAAIIIAIITNTKNP
jgi:hypothetical protein